MRKLFPPHRYCSKTLLRSCQPRPVGPVSLFHASSKAKRPVSGPGDAVSSELEGEAVGTARVSRAWPEWTGLMEMLARREYPEGGDSPVRGGRLGGKEANWVRTACLKFARERLGLIRVTGDLLRIRLPSEESDTEDTSSLRITSQVGKFLSRKDIQVIAGYGCPSVDRKVVNSGKRLRAHVGLNEGNVCSSCNLRGNCDRAYVKAREDEPGRTVDVMRFLLTYGLDFISGTQENKQLNNKMVTESVRRLLNEMVENSSQQLNSSEPSGQQSEMHPPDNPSSQEKGCISVPMKQGDWICPRCNFLNFRRNIKCLRCDVLSQEKVKQIQEDQEHLPLKKGDWICEKCNFLNFAKNTRCLLCTEKPPKRHLHPGEWECQSCNYINFRRNMKCLKCEHNRPKALNSSKTMMQEEIKVGSGGRNHSGGWSFVEEEDKHEQKITSNEDSRFADFPILGGHSNLSRDVEKRERWKAEMSERRRGASKTEDKDDGFKQQEAPERFKYLGCSDDEELAEWFGHEKKLETEGSESA